MAILLFFYLTIQFLFGLIFQNINIASVDIKVNGAVATAYFIVQIKNKRQLDRLIKKLYNITHVDKVERIGK